MKKCLFLFLSVLFVFSSCKSTLKSNKSEDYTKQIDSEINVYVAMHATNKQKSKFLDALAKKVADDFDKRGIKANTQVFRLDEEDDLDKFLDENILPIHPDGQTLLIVETGIELQHGYGTVGYAEFSIFTMVLTDHSLKKDVWISESKTGWGILVGGVDTFAGHISKRMVKTMERDNLLKKVDTDK